MLKLSLAHCQQEKEERCDVVIASVTVRPDTGEKRLMCAVLEEAIFSLQRHNLSPESARAREEYREDMEWVESKDDSWLYSFEHICQALEIEPNWMREKVRKLLARQREQQKVARRRRRSFSVKSHIGIDRKAA